MDAAGRAPPTPGRSRRAAFINGKLYVVGGWGSDGDPRRQDGDLRPGVELAGRPGPPRPSRTPARARRCWTASCTSSAAAPPSPAAWPTSRSTTRPSNTWSRGRRVPRGDRLGVLRRDRRQALLRRWHHRRRQHRPRLRLRPGPATPGRRVANMPTDLWGSASTAANGLLLVSGGVTGNGASITNQGYAYNPQTDAWTALPNANQTRVPRRQRVRLLPDRRQPRRALRPAGRRPSEVLPGFTDCDAVADVPGCRRARPTRDPRSRAQSAKITVTLNANVADDHPAGHLHGQPRRSARTRRTRWPRSASR